MLPFVRRAVLLTASAFLPAIPSISQTPSTSLPRVTQKMSQTVPARKAPSDQEIVAPFWTTEPGWNSRLEIRNNLAQSDLEVTPVLRIFDGRELTLPSVKVGPDEVKQVDLSRTAASPGGHTEAYGSVLFRYKSVSRENVYAAVLVQRLGHPIKHATLTRCLWIPRSAPPPKKEFWWLPNPTTDGFSHHQQFRFAPVMAKETFTDGTHSVCNAVGVATPSDVSDQHPAPRNEFDSC